MEKREATIQYLFVSTSTTRHPCALSCLISTNDLVILPPDTIAVLPLNGTFSGASPKRRWSRVTMAVQVATSGRLAASPASTSIDHRRGSIISAKVLCGGVTTVSGVATMSTSALDSSAMDVFGDMRLPAGALGVPTVFSSEAILVCVCEAVRRDGIDSEEVSRSGKVLCTWHSLHALLEKYRRIRETANSAAAWCRSSLSTLDSPVDRLQEDQAV